RLHLLQHQADRAKGRVRPGRGWRARWWFHGRHERDICIAGNRQPSVPVTEAVDALSLLAKVDGELCEVAIGRNDAEAVDAPGMKQIHGVDRQPYVGGVLSRSRREAMPRIEREARRGFSPTARGPIDVAVEALHMAFTE